MALTWVWVGMVCVALIYGAATGQSAAVGAAAAQGVQQAVTFCLTVGGMICLWSGVMEVMRRSGIAAGLSRLLQPVNVSSKILVSPSGNSTCDKSLHCLNVHEPICSTLSGIVMLVSPLSQNE